MRKRKSPVAASLVKNSKAAMISAIEIHNKPIFGYRYEVCVLLIINAWELILKAYIYKRLKNVKLRRKDGTTKPFDECLSCVSSHLGKDFQAAEQSIKHLYSYRNNVAHFYCENIDLILYSLLKANVQFYNEFIQNQFKCDLTKETNLVLLPIGFAKPYSPIDFLSDESAIISASREVKDFVYGIIKSCANLQEMGVEDSILVDFKMHLINETRIKNSDIIAGINNAAIQSNNIEVQNILKNCTLSDLPNAKTIRIQDDSQLLKIYTEKYEDVRLKAKEIFEDFVQNNEFYMLLAEIKENHNIYTVRYLDPSNPGGLKKGYFTKEVYDELAKHYRRKSDA